MQAAAPAAAAAAPAAAAAAPIQLGNSDAMFVLQSLQQAMMGVQESQHKMQQSVDRRLGTLEVQLEQGRQQAEVLTMPPTPQEAQYDDEWEVQQQHAVQTRPPTRQQQQQVVQTRPPPHAQVQQEQAQYDDDWEVQQQHAVQTRPPTRQHQQQVVQTRPPQHAQVQQEQQEQQAVGFSRQQAAGAAAGSTPPPRGMQQQRQQQQAGLLQQQLVGKQQVQLQEQVHPPVKQVNKQCLSCTFIALVGCPLSLPSACAVTHVGRPYQSCSEVVVRDHCYSCFPGCMHACTYVLTQ